MNVYLATLAEIAAFRLRVLAYAIGSKSEATERDLAVKALNVVARELSGKNLPARVIVDTRQCARHQIQFATQGTLSRADVLGWASAWTEWVTWIDERDARNSQTAEK